MACIKHIILIIGVLLAVSACGGGGGTESSQYRGTVVDTVFIEGTHNTVRCPISVYLPPLYGDDPDQIYPVLYVLDAEGAFLPTVGLVDDNQKPIIVVGIGNSDGRCCQYQRQ